MRKLKKMLAGVLAVSLTVSTLYMGNGMHPQAARVSADTTQTAGIKASDFLKANGKVLRNNYGSGNTVYLRGTNAGGYTVQEFWMCPTNYSTNVTCQMDILNQLTERFGSEKARTLVKAYENNYWTEADFDRCASLGINCIRLPLWYRNFVDENNNWYSDAFDMTDWFIEQAGKRGIYVIIDMHGAYGSQNGSDHSGVDGGEQKLAASEFFFGGNAAANQEKYYAMWEKIAEHYKGNPAVAGYDLLNEPYCTYRYNSGYSDDQLHSWLWTIYDNAYKRIRAMDSDHVIIMEATWDSWDLPNPTTYGWENVMYEYHNYEYSDYDNASNTQITSMQNKINNIFSANYNVPSYMGEFCYFNNLDAWDAGLKLLNDSGLNWTSWTYKCVAEYGNWGLVNQSIDKVNVESDSYETILSKWSNAGSCYENTGLTSVFKKYTPGTVSTLEISSISEGEYYLVCSDKVVCAENEGNDPLIANRDSYGGSWETLHVVNNADGTISLKSDINGKYVCAVIDEDCQLLARSEVISDWEKFYLVHIQSNQYALCSYANGKYVKADFDDTENNGQLKAVSDSIGGAWEAFYFNRVDGGEVTQAPTTAAPVTQVPTTVAPTTTEGKTGYAAAGENWTDTDFWSVYFASGWANNPQGMYKAGNSYNDFAVYVQSESKTAWGIQLKTKELPVVAGKKYICKVSAISNVRVTDIIQFKDEKTNTSKNYTLQQGNNIFEVEFTASDSNVAQIFFDLGFLPQGTDFVITSFSLEAEEEAETTAAPATEEPTTEQQTTIVQITGPMEVFGEIISSTSNNTITVVWGQNDEQIKNGQKYNVYVDGSMVLSSVACGQYDIGNVTAGTHSVKITAVLNGQETNGVTARVTVTGEISTEAPTIQETTEPETTTEEETTTIHTIAGGIEVNGYQISAGAKGMRTIYSVDNTIDGKDVVSSGIVYSLEGYADEKDMYVGSTSNYVRSYQSTSDGKCGISFSESDIATSYAMTMKFATKEALEYTTGWRIRAYAELSDGSYVYTDIYTYTIFEVADELYQECRMNTEAAHNYLYTDILSIVEKDYIVKDYTLNHSLVGA